MQLTISYKIRICAYFYDVLMYFYDLLTFEFLILRMCVNSIEMSDKISDKMTSALLAISLSYYYVMEEHVEKETRTDEILSTLLNCSKNKMHTNTEQTKGKCNTYICI